MERLLTPYKQIVGNSRLFPFVTNISKNTCHKPASVISLRKLIENCELTSVSNQQFKCLDKHGRDGLHLQILPLGGTMYIENS